MTLISEGWRAAGLLLHPTSLYTPYGVGDLGPAAHDLIPFLKRAGLHFWQTLPLTPTSPGLGNSPYSAFSAFAGNTLLISPDLMVRDGWLSAGEVRPAEAAPGHQVDFVRVSQNKSGLIDLAFERAENHLSDHRDFQDFAWNNGAWMNDYAFFTAAKNYFGGGCWLSWPEGLTRREDSALREWGLKLARPILREKFAQFLFFGQLAELKGRLHQAGLGLIGDAAIYVNHDSSDVWAQPGLFQLDGQGRPAAVAGVPPDYFAPRGQLWGNPLFDWAANRAQGYDWWKNRLWYMLRLYDWIRLDHFRAFAAYWSVPAGAETSASGSWQPGPGADLFQAASSDRHLPIIAEDLGVITPDVTALRRAFGYPGMRIMQFAFGPEMGLCSHAPFRVEPDNVVYTATHDNNTTRGWFRQESTLLARRQLADLCGFEIREDNAAWALTRLAWLSPGALAILPLADLLNLDETARLNTPGIPSGNWGWRLPGPGLLTDQLAGRLAELSALAGRDNCEHPNILTY
ncbi:MAG: 4-alpha-glucanotransferase [Candidatus Adiutrix sp.]|jgi:4-alpha-glucanotransferase|nr:4-alpha-glucanotransferase [Candidatus Adiutrix sp.]